jgi:hypothetical protein
MICSEHTALVKRHNRFEFFRKVAGRQRWFGGAEGHVFMSSVTIKSYSIDHDLLEANSREERCGAYPLGRRRRGQRGALQGERSLHWALGGSSGLKSTTPPKLGLRAVLADTQVNFDRGAVQPSRGCYELHRGQTVAFEHANQNALPKRRARAPGRGGRTDVR